MTTASSVSDFDVFSQALTVLMSWRRTGLFDTRVRFRVGLQHEREETLHLRANPRELTYELYTEGGVLEERYDGFAHTIDRAVGSESWPTGRQNLRVGNIQAEAVPTRLAFVHALPVWGRNLEYRFTGEASATKDHIELRLRHTTDIELWGTLIISVPHRMAIEIDTPTLLISYEDFKM